MILKYKKSLISPFFVIEELGFWSSINAPDCGRIKLIESKSNMLTAIIFSIKKNVFISLTIYKV